MPGIPPGCCQFGLVKVMNRKLCAIAIALMTFAIIVVPAAAVLPEDSPFPNGTGWKNTWDLLVDLQNQINNIQLIPGPQGSQGPQGPPGETGSCTCPISQADFDALAARVAALENGNACQPESCTHPPESSCDGNRYLVSYAVPGACDAGCDCCVYTMQITDCGESGRVCVADDPNGRAPYCGV